jgi:hypothetical protein
MGFLRMAELRVCVYVCIISYIYIMPFGYYIYMLF